MIHPLILKPKLDTVDPNLMAHWKMDETSGTRVYCSANGYDADVYSNLIMNETGVIGSAFGFSDEGYFITDSSDSTPITGPFSLSVWTKLNNGASGYSRIMGKKGEFSWFVYSGEMQLRIYRNGTSEYMGCKTNNVVARDGSTWNNIVTTYDDSASYSGIKHYVNGTSISPIYQQSYGWLDQMAHTSYKYYVGREEEAWSNRFQGSLDDLRIYTKELTEAEITALYQEGI